MYTKNWNFFCDFFKFSPIGGPHDSERRLQDPISIPFDSHSPGAGVAQTPAHQKLGEILFFWGERWKKCVFQRHIGPFFISCVSPTGLTHMTHIWLESPSKYASNSIGHYGLGPVGAPILADEREWCVEKFGKNQQRPLWWPRKGSRVANLCWHGGTIGQSIQIAV